MNPKPVIIACIIAVLFVATVYFSGQSVLERGRIDNALPVVPAPKHWSVQGDNAVKGNKKTPINILATDELTDEQQPHDPVPPTPTVEPLERAITEEAEKPNYPSEEVSPYGFGPYPEVPTNFDFTPSWQRPPLSPKFGTERRKWRELMSRVQIKAWTEGIRGWTGVSVKNGKIYLHFPDVIYVEYGDPIEKDDGTVVKPIVGTMGVILTQEQAENGELPEGYHVIELDQAGYDPYEYLDLP